MSDCCATTLDGQFGERAAKQKLRGYRKRGAAKETRLLIDALVEAGVAGASVLDIGAGIGNVHGELLQSGAVRATSVDASHAFEQAAQELAAERGYRDRVDYELGDFVDVARHVPGADVVALDKVICCYPDMDRLVALSAERAQRLYGLVYPRDAALQRGVVRIHNALRRLFRSEFRAYVHPRAAVEGKLRERGFRLRSSAQTTVWLVQVFER